MSDRTRAWIRLPSGAALDLIHPSPEAWTHHDLALRLARTYRWGGESVWPWPLSVAQHSMLVLQLRQQWAQAEGETLSNAAALAELLHDAEEGFLGFDCISPLKRVLGEPFRIVGDRLMQAIAMRYQLPDWTTETYALHKRADSIAAASEAVHCTGWSVTEVREVLGISHPVLDTDPLQAVYGGAAWEPWPSDVAAQRFLQALLRLMPDTVDEGKPRR
ncbi:phosphohydrolase [Roseateles amylovorans]|uniref:Phosphohydrolase n=1 Tax=Roseateles amylovorans TaxID=2978473 RepID=A0ABY6B7B9_9BURK|nr:phosphohydrolase [Roseateles amylovorans]UXH80732.1 phosphohydrolase [Roseateles amylovorans]